MKKTIFLDRDGTINIDKGYVHKIEDFKFTHLAIEALREFKNMGYQLIIITNQSGIARGYYSVQDLEKLNKWMNNVLLMEDVIIDGFYYCPHYPNGKVKEYSTFCKCRKPGTKLFYNAIKDYNVDVNKSFVIGDKMKDLAISYETNIKAIYIEKYPKRIKCIEVKKEICVVNSLYEAMIYIKKNKK